jgi:hypothetical protein
MSGAGRELPELPDIPALLNVFVKHAASFLVIGGAAVAHHGFVRATKDLDIVPRPDTENLTRLYDALMELEAQPLALGDFRPEELPVPLTVEGLCGHGNCDQATRYGRVNLVQYIAAKLESEGDYEQLDQAAEDAHYDFGTVRYVGYADLLDFKNIAGRDQDLIDIRALREARDDIGPEVAR